MAKTENMEIFPKGTTKTYGLMELIKRESPSAVDRGPEDTVFVWPNLLYIELITILGALVMLMLMAIMRDAPLEELANIATTPNPMKAPWYFLGLQELLVYFDPWIAGVVLPSLIIAGLVVIPYVDVNPKGAGTYGFNDRKFAVTVFLFGVALWYIMIIIGTYTRGMDWQWYWPWDDWHVHKPLGAAMTDLEIVFQKFFGMGEFIARAATYVLCMGYYVVGFALPCLMFQKFYKSLGFIRYSIVMFFVLTMMAVPLKVYARLLFSIKYVLITPWFKI